jgi:hypothetical protein
LTCDYTLRQWAKDAQTASAPVSNGEESMSKILAIATGVLFIATASHAQPLMAPIPDNNELHQEILGGKPANPKNWPVTLQFESPGGFCTSTIIGEKVVITAGHCVQNQQKARVFFNNKLTTVTCHHHPQYKGAACLSASSVADIKGCTADISLCVADEPFPTSVGGQPVKYETVNSDPQLLKKDGPITLLGYGCTQAGGAVSPILRIGVDTTVTSLSVPGASSNPANTMQEYIITQGSAVCQGDSGGAAFNTQEANRKVVAVNSRGNIATVSFLTATSDPHIQAFFKDFAGPPRNLQICGVTAGTNNCR